MILTFSLVFVLCIVGIIVGGIDIFINYSGIGWYIILSSIYVLLINGAVSKWWEH
jgi:hypothetical protein